MNRTFKILSILAAVLALSAVLASAASAAGEYTCAAYPCEGTATSAFGNDTFTVAGGTVQCHVEYKTAVINGPVSRLTVTPIFKEHCKFNAFSASIEMNGCDYVFETPVGSGDNWAAPVEVVCPPEKVITIKVPATTGTTCHLSIPPQTPGGSVAITNDTASGDVTVDADVTNIHYTNVVDGVGCPLEGKGTKTGASYTQHAPITVHSPGKSVSVS
jgi:hypothetical protein